MTLVAGIDPGSRYVGWAILGIGAHVYVVAQGMMDLGVAGERTLVELVRHKLRAYRVPRVGVERVGQVNYRPGFGAKMATDLVASNGIGQRIAQALLDDGRNVDEFPAEAWHEHYFGQRAVDGKAVAALVAGRVTGWPPKSNAHARDAAGVALFASTRGR